MGVCTWLVEEVDQYLVEEAMLESHFSRNKEVDQYLVEEAKYVVGESFLKK